MSSSSSSRSSTASDPNLPPPNRRCRSACTLASASATISSWVLTPSSPPSVLVRLRWGSCCGPLPGGGLRISRTDLRFLITASRPLFDAATLSCSAVMKPSSSSSSSSLLVASSFSVAGAGAGASATGAGVGSKFSCFFTHSPVLGSTSFPDSSTTIGIISSGATAGFAAVGFSPPLRVSAVDIPNGSFAFAAASAPRPVGATGAAEASSGPGPPVNFLFAVRFPCSSHARIRSRSFASSAAFCAASALAAALRRAASSAAATFARSASASLATDLASADPGLYSPRGSARRSSRSSLSSSDLRSPI
mmetsp:Transcript_14420/g.58831  ORF Transcript_14420/g.58831 Transcript_14420/m.58831 type:complete len:307 (+) Transcript_14420:3390-4310(+)